MSREQRAENWHTPDSLGDTQEVRPPGELLAGRPQPLELRRFSVRQREEGVSLNFYTRKHLSGIPAYGVTVAPEMAIKIAEQVILVATQVLTRKGRATP